MTDTYLVSILKEKHQWMPLVYEKCSGVVHLSNVHITTLFSPEESEIYEDQSEITLNMKIGSDRSQSQPSGTSRQ